MNDSMQHTVAAETEPGKITTDTQVAPAWFADRSHCPGWCTAQHLQSFKEGCGLDDSAVHETPDLTGHLYEIRYGGRRVDRPEHGGWSTQLFEQPADVQSGNSTGLPLVHLETVTVDYTRRVVLPLTSGEARVLAAQLVHLADLADLS